ncbi:TPA: nitronate monooxygenase [Stenotrophomonas maltophilia]|jgi:nitronate monooxygenase|uniref:NAD(P)H-dependent flavin oxidoreductase n=1 Tax=Burkholderia sp. LMG 13014 TaxID=2709306 RepID=UPI00196239AC|nr:nitronate monooxygenase [Burkholderia sp. LMG 13014]HDS1367968.1 nitronate monooxygenase [Stenotrophomonas maltophilia]HEJ3239980.1 nitronate monooxygenase [Pseudomonas aeruginosa]HDS1372582.1 nitronate monooxygenase [Stenotrophomonas maltophilia]HDS1376507.1 nitronate monooxygenase [Stenotrophomonas maltophilia]HDS1381361.1 nitronate monooxygenase [Stenotrophomonas maltophilia]
MTTSKQFLARLGLRHPIIQAPMAGVATPRLAATVSNAGGLGSLGMGASTVEQARQAIRETRAMTEQPFNVNVFCHAPAHRDPSRERAWLAYLAPLFAEVGMTPPLALDEHFRTFLGDDEAFEMLLEERPSVVSFHFGLPAIDRLQALRDAGIYTMATATNLQDAQRIEQAGVDAIVAQGIEAGGHRGFFDPTAADERLSTSVLVRLLVQRSSLPVVAAGGIMDGQGIKAALSLGAVAAQLGTAFVLCPESAANDSYRASLKSERATATRLTSVLSGRPARGIANRLITFGEAADSPPPPAFPVAYDATRQLNAAAADSGNQDFAAQWAGQGAPLAREMPATQLFSTLVEELASRPDAAGGTAG